MNINTEENQFIKTQVKQYKNEKLSCIDEIISCEESFVFSYTCTFKDKNWKGEKNIYAYPEDIEKLVIGHTILDLLPCYHADFSYKISQKEKTYTLDLEAKEKQKKEIGKISMPSCSMPLSEVLETMDKVLSAKGKWSGTGCFHRASLYHPITKEIIIVEDIGRHNCVDRLKGHCIINNLPIEEYFLFITARITASIYDKIRRAGISTIISRSAITSTPFLKSQQDNCTLIAFCRHDGKDNEGRFTIFNKGQNEFF